MDEKRIKMLVNYSGETKEVILSKLEEAKKELAELFDIEGEDLESQAMDRIFAMYAKKKLSLLEEFEGVIFGFGDKTDYGASNIYNEIKDSFEKGDDNLKRALYESGKIDENGNPLWNPDNTKATFKYQDKEGNLLDNKSRMIDLDKDTKMVGVGYLRKNDDETYRPAIVSISGRKLIDIPIKKRISLKLGGRLDDKTGFYRLGVNVDNFKCEEIDNKVMSYKDYEEIIKNSFGDYVLDFNEESLYKWIESRDMKDYPVVFVINGIATNVNPTDKGRSNIVVMTNINQPEEHLTCFYPKSFDLPIEMTGGLIVVGNIGGNREKGFSINVMDSMMKYKPKKMEEIKPVQKKEEKTESPSWLKK